VPLTPCLLASCREALSAEELERGRLLARRLVSYLKGPGRSGLVDWVVGWPSADGVPCFVVPHLSLSQCDTHNTLTSNPNAYKAFPICPVHTSIQVHNWLDAATHDPGEGFTTKNPAQVEGYPRTPNIRAAERGGCLTQSLLVCCESQNSRLCHMRLLLPAFGVSGSHCHRSVCTVGPTSSCIHSATSRFSLG
jgi:hypothetical protein